MPKPCKRPLTPNPFESYRDPVTGQWRVRYAADAIPTESTSLRGVSALQRRTENIARESTARDRITA